MYDFVSLSLSERQRKRERKRVRRDAPLHTPWGLALFPTGIRKQNLRRPALAGQTGLPHTPAHGASHSRGYSENRCLLAIPSSLGGRKMSGGEGASGVGRHFARVWAPPLSLGQGWKRRNPHKQPSIAS